MENKMNEKKVSEKKRQSRTKSKDGVCPYAKRCGGCDYQGISYKEQLEKKESNVKKLLKECMESAIELKIPLTVDVASGKSWLDC